MRLLLDTHTFLWWYKDDKKLGRKARSLIVDAVDVSVSVASAWEFSIKKALGKLDLVNDFEMAVEETGFSKLMIGFEHARVIATMMPYNNDPFDRMLVAQAMVENVTLVTADKKLSAYPVRILNAEK